MSVRSAPTMTAMLSDALEVIPEDTPAKEARLAAMDGGRESRTVAGELCGATPLDRQLAAAWLLTDDDARRSYEAAARSSQARAPTLSAFNPNAKSARLAQARRAPFYKGKLDHVNAERLDDADEWRKIPIFDKETLRKLDDREFYEHFCLASDDGIAEYWRSGGATGTPLFYPRSYRRHCCRHGRLRAHLRLYELSARRAGACVVSARHSSGRPDAGACRRHSRHRRQLGGLRQHHAVGYAARIDRSAAARPSGWA